MRRTGTTCSSPPMCSPKALTCSRPGTSSTTTCRGTRCAWFSGTAGSTGSAVSTHGARVADPGGVRPGDLGQPGRRPACGQGVGDSRGEPVTLGGQQPWRAPGGELSGEPSRSSVTTMDTVLATTRILQMRRGCAQHDIPRRQRESGIGASAGRERVLRRSPTSRTVTRSTRADPPLFSSPNLGVNAVAAAAFCGVLLCGVDSLSEVMSPP